jgi:hypothetical protein
MMTDKELRRLDMYMGGEIAKRWPLRYRNRRSGMWIFTLPSGNLSNLRLYEYHHPKMHQVSVVRVSDIFSIPASVEDPYINTKAKPKLKLSFLPEEAELVIPWALDNYVAKSGDYPAFMAEHWKGNFEEDNDGYFWSQSAWDKARLTSLALTASQMSLTHK